MEPILVDFYYHLNIYDKQKPWEGCSRSGKKYFDKSLSIGLRL